MSDAAGFVLLGAEMVGYARSVRFPLPALATFIGACIALFALFTGIGEGLRYAITEALIDLR